MVLKHYLELAHICYSFDPELEMCDANFTPLLLEIVLTQLLLWLKLFKIFLLLQSFRKNLSQKSNIATNLLEKLTSLKLFSFQQIIFCFCYSNYKLNTNVHTLK